MQTVNGNMKQNYSLLRFAHSFWFVEILCTVIPDFFHPPGTRRRTFWVAVYECDYAERWCNNKCQSTKYCSVCNKRINQNFSRALFREWFISGRWHSRWPGIEYIIFVTKEWEIVYNMQNGIWNVVKFFTFIELDLRCTWLITDYFHQCRKTVDGHFKLCWNNVFKKQRTKRQRSYPRNHAGESSTVIM